MGMRHTILIVALTLAASDAHAESSPHKEPGTATLVSIGATVLPIAVGAAIVSKEDVGAAVLIGAGAILGPSAGHWYAGELGLPGLAIRGAGITIMAVVANDAAGCFFKDGGEEGKNCKLVNAVAIVGAGVYLGGVVYDWATANASARRHNARSLSIAPTMVSGTRSTGAGLGITGSF
jgi:hypothetical protein